jgi:hypothetical protein
MPRVVWPGVRWAGLGEAEPGADAGPAARSAAALIHYGLIRHSVMMSAAGAGGRVAGVAHGQGLARNSAGLVPSH